MIRNHNKHLRTFIFAFKYRQRDDAETEKNRELTKGPTASKIESDTFQGFRGHTCYEHTQINRLCVVCARNNGIQAAEKWKLGNPELATRVLSSDLLVQHASSCVVGSGSVK